MPKTSGAFNKFSGMVDDIVFVNSKHGTIVRSAPPKGNRKEEPAFKKQYSRTAFLNQLASDISSAIGPYSNRLKDSDLYSRINKHLRREPQDIRLLVLSELEGMEISPRNSMQRLHHRPEVAVKRRKGDIILTVTAGFQILDTKTFNCYYMEVALLRWNKSKKECLHSSMKTDWIFGENKRCSGEFVFPGCQDTTDYLVAIRTSIGLNKAELDLVDTQGMVIVKAGTFSKEQLKLLNEKRALKEKEMSKPSERKQPEGEKVVMKYVD